jgi:hypothetical protein
MKHLIASVTIGACLLVPSAGMTLAQKAPVTGQPGTNNNVNCGMGMATNVPGGSGAATTQSPFPGSGGNSGTVYANTKNGFGASQNSNNLSATSQYDIACLKSQTP